MHSDAAIGDTGSSISGLDEHNANMQMPLSSHHRSALFITTPRTRLLTHMKIFADMLVIFSTEEVLALEAKVDSFSVVLRQTACPVLRVQG
jgi:hypothetical protein